MGRLAVAFCGLLLLAACGAGPVSGATQDLQPLGRQPSTAASTNRPRPLGSGLDVTVSAPKLFTPTEAAYPRAARAVAFDLVIQNHGADVYRPSQLAVTATSDGAPALQVIDSTQGYSGLVGVTEEVPPGHDVHVTVAFALPTGPSAVRLTVQPNAMDGIRTTVFDGTL